MKKRLSFRVREEIATRIASGHIGPGTKLPPEPELAEEMGVSRATLREALRSLEEDGFVTRTRGAGTYATRRPRLRNNLDVNFGVTEAIRSSGMRPGTKHGSIHTQGATAEQAASNHSPLFYVDESGLLLGVKALAHVAVDYLSAR